MLQIALRRMRSLELRVVGSVEPPNVDISVVSFCSAAFDENAPDKNK